MNQKKEGFTLIELIIVVVIIAILALVAIPKYYASVTKTQKKQVFANLHMIRNALLNYYAIYGVYPPNGTFPVTVTLDGDTIISIPYPASSGARWWYYYNVLGENAVYAFTEASAGVRDRECIVYMTTGSEECWYW
jgi:prepilin-type N-terminal cleavage/methylation domain-containing protein